MIENFSFSFSFKLSTAAWSDNDQQKIGLAGLPSPSLNLAPKTDQQNVASDLFLKFLPLMELACIDSLAFKHGRRPASELENGRERFDLLGIITWLFMEALGGLSAWAGPSLSRLPDQVEIGF